MHSTMLASINLFPVLPSLAYTLSNLNKDKKLQDSLLGQMGDYTGKILNIAGIILSTSVFLFFK